MLGTVHGGTKKYEVRLAQLNQKGIEMINSDHIYDSSSYEICKPPTRFVYLFPLQNDVIESPMSYSTRRNLRLVNFGLGCFHTAFAVLVAIGLPGFDTKLDLSIPTYKSALTMNNSSRSFFVPIYIESGALYITWITMAFFALSAVFHLSAALLYPQTYLYLIDHKICPFRWMEYTFSAAIMYLAIAFPTGILSREALFSGFFLIATTMFFGLMTEFVARPAANNKWSNSFAVRITPHVLGYVPQCAAWFIILLQFFDRPSNAPEPPAFVYALVLTELALFFSFGYIQLYQQCKTPSFYIYGEYIYMLLSLISKGALGAILFTNVLFLSNFSCIIDPDRSEC